MAKLGYNVDDLLPICNELNIPLVFDYHHDWIYPSARTAVDLIPEINRLWERKGSNIIASLGRVQ